MENVTGFSQIHFIRNVLDRKYFSIFIYQKTIKLFAFLQDAFSVVNLVNFDPVYQFISKFFVKQSICKNTCIFFPSKCVMHVYMDVHLLLGINKCHHFWSTQTLTNSSFHWCSVGWFEMDFPDLVRCFLVIICKWRHQTKIENFNWNYRSKKKILSITECQALYSSVLNNTHNL